MATYTHDGTDAHAPQQWPGFWQVPQGMLIEKGDQLVPRRGTLQTVALEQIGQPVTQEMLVLRVERRREPR